MLERGSLLRVCRLNPFVAVSTKQLRIFPINVHFLNPPSVRISVLMYGILRIINAAWTQFSFLISASFISFPPSEDWNHLEATHLREWLNVAHSWQQRSSSSTVYPQSKHFLCRIQLSESSSYRLRMFGHPVSWQNMPLIIAASH